VALRVPQSTHTLLERREEKRILLLAVSGERGLCGAFNANVIRRTLEFAREHSAQNPSLIVLGRKIRDAMRKQRWKIIAEHVDVTGRPSLGAAGEITKDVISLYESGEIDAVYIVFNEFKSVLAQILRLEKLLPIEPDRALASEEDQEKSKEAPIDYLYEQPPGEILGHLLPRYVQVQIFRALAESAASEHAARMTAMDSATNNAGELIDKLTLYMNKVRQAAITKEIIEVVSGAASAA
jgi:F-type H+-transporting ATPase subunit gamma